MNWLNWIAGITGVGTIGLIALAFLAPGIFQTVVEFIKPWAKMLGEGTSWLVKKVLSWLWEGLKDIFDNIMTIFTVGVLVAVAFIYGGMQADVISLKPTNDCRDLASVRPDYKLVKRTPEEKRAYLDRVNADQSWIKKLWAK